MISNIRLQCNHCYLKHRYLKVPSYILNTVWKYIQFLLHFNSCYLKLLPSTLVENASYFCNNIHVQTNNHSVYFMFLQIYMSFAWAPTCCIWMKSVFRRNHVTSRVHFNTFLYKMDLAKFRTCDRKTKKMRTLQR